MYAMRSVRKIPSSLKSTGSHSSAKGANKCPILRDSSATVRHASLHTTDLKSEICIEIYVHSIWLEDVRLRRGERRKWKRVWGIDESARRSWAHDIYRYWVSQTKMSDTLFVLCCVCVRTCILFAPITMPKRMWVCVSGKSISILGEGERKVT